jgi:hypothetical protein
MSGAKGPGDHLRKVFYRMGFNDQEIVALSGMFTCLRLPIAGLKFAHTLVVVGCRCFLSDSPFLETTVL